MKQLTALLLLVAVAAMVGCKNNQADDFDQVPGPADDAAYDASVNFEPVEVTGGEPLFIDTPPATPPPAAMGASYTIVKGDTLWSIAKRHYGNGNRWPDIVAANPSLEPTKLAVGQVITLP